MSSAFNEAAGPHETRTIQRDMRRRVFTILILLLAGAVVNVAVAWGCAMVGAGAATDGTSLFLAVERRISALRGGIACRRCGPLRVRASSRRRSPGLEGSRRAGVVGASGRQRRFHARR